jgi:uncharacterized protein YegP (UPF0339 family)
MSARDLKFVIFRDMKDGYRWRLSSTSGQTVERSERGHRHKDECAQEVFRLKDHRYPRAVVIMGGPVASHSHNARSSPEHHRR